MGTVTDLGYGALAMDDPWAVVMIALTHQARGEVISEDLADAVQEAASFLAAALLVQSGLSMEAAERLFCEREYDVRLTYERATDLIGIQIDWKDGGLPLKVTNE